MTTINGTAIAGGAIVAALIDMLVKKGVLSAADIGELMSNARLVPFQGAMDVEPARETIRSIAAGYAQRGG